MIFDKLCAIIESHYPEFMHILADAKIFYFDQERPPRNELLVGPLEVSQFYLPFSTTCLVFRENCYVYRDSCSQQKGVEQERFIIAAEALEPTLNALSEKVKETASQGALKKILDTAAKLRIDYRQALIITIGVIKNTAGVEIDQFEARLFDYFGADKKAILFSRYDDSDLSWRKFIDEDNYNSMANGALEAATDMIGFIIHHLINPEKFILETCPRKIKTPDSKKIPRSHQRPLYTILHPHKIREKMRVPHPTGTGAGKGGPITPHERRRHERFLSDSKYKFDLTGRPIEPQPIPYGPRKGESYYKKVDVPATWIGATESRVGNKIYRVILDR